MQECKSFEEILQLHHGRYPGMQIADMVKLIYQNEFAGGHLIDDEDRCLKRLTEEIRLLRGSSVLNIPSVLFEEIGNGLCRLNLAAKESLNIDIETINRFFISTSNYISGNIQSFEEKLSIFKQCCVDGTLPYKPEKVEDWLEEYRKQGYPPMHHSGEYRALYSPAYRIVKLDYLYYLDIFRRIDALIKTHDRILVAIDGNCGAGKSTLAALIGDIYDRNIFHMDDFFLNSELKTQERMKEIGGNVDYIRFKEEVIAGLQSGQKFEYRKYDCKTMNMDKRITVLPKKLNIIEGAYSMHPSLEEYYDFKIFLGIDEIEQRDRILERNGETMLDKFLSKWIPMENAYFEHYKIEEKCDLVYKSNH